MCRQQVYCK